MEIRSVSALSSPAYAAAPNSLPVKSGRKDVDALLTGTTRWWHDGSGAVAAATSSGMTTARHALTFSFMSVANSSRANDLYGFQAMTDTTKAAVRSALDYVASVANLTFEEVDAGGHLQFGTNHQRGQSGGYAYTPHSAAVDTASVYMANDAFNQATTDWSVGTRAWASLVHEVGHALGLKHPGAYNAGGGKTPGPYLPGSTDSTEYSLMSYKDHPGATVARTVNRDGGGFTLSLSKVQAEGFQMLDLAALQYLYGKSTSAAQTGARTYAFTDDDAPFLRTLSNTNANSEIDASATTRANVIDLRAGNFSSIGLRSAYAGLNPMIDTAKEYASVVRGTKPTYTGANNLGIAEGSHIDKAKSGSGNDVIVGNNDATNTIDAGAGHDTVYLGRASSTVECGTGTDTVCLPRIARSAWTVTFDAGTGTYTCRNGAITSTVTGAESIKGWDGKRLKITRLA